MTQSQIVNERESMLHKIVNSNRYDVYYSDNHNYPWHEWDISDKDKEKYDKDYDTDVIAVYDVSISQWVNFDPLSPDAACGWIISEWIGSIVAESAEDALDSCIGA